MYQIFQKSIPICRHILDFCWSIHCATMIVYLKQTLKFSNVVEAALNVVKTVLVIYPLYLHINFRIWLLVSAKGKRILDFID